MKKIFRAIAFCIFLAVSSILPSQRSEAAVGLAVGPAAVLFAGAVFVVHGVTLGLAYGDSLDKKWSYKFTAVPSVFFGVLLLDSPTTPITFSALDSESAKKLGAKSEDMVTFNSELDEARAVGEAITKNLVSKYGEQRNIDFKSVSSDAQKQWNKVCESELLSAGTCRVISAIRNQK